HAAFAINESFQALVHAFAAHVEAAYAERAAVVELEVAALLVLGGYEQEWLVGGGGQLDHAVLVGAGLGQGAALQVRHLHLHAAHGIRGAQVAHGDQQRAIVAALGDEAEVRGEEVALHHTGFAAEVARRARVLAVLPVIILLVVAVVIVVVVIAIRRIP